MRATVRAFAVLAALAGATAAQSQTLFKCTVGGQVAFQQQPCAAGKAEVVDAKPANVVAGQPAGERGLRSQVARDSLVRDAQAGGRVLPGMSWREAYQVLGQPQVVNTDRYANGVREQHVFRGPGGTTYVYTENGVVTAVQDRPALPSARAANCATKADIAGQDFLLSSVTRTEDEKREIRSRIRDMQSRRCD